MSFIPLLVYAWKRVMHRVGNGTGHKKWLHLVEQLYRNDMARVHTQVSERGAGTVGLLVVCVCARHVCATCVRSSTRRHSFDSRSSGSLDHDTGCSCQWANVTSCISVYICRTVYSCLLLSCFRFGIFSQVLSLPVGHWGLGWGACGGWGWAELAVSH